MEMFDKVVIACDQTSLDLALAIRGALELFRLHVYLHFCVQKKNVVDFMAGRIPKSEYIVLCAHGVNDTSDKLPARKKMGVGFIVVDKAKGEWDEVDVNLTPDNISQRVKLRGRRVIALGCGNGQAPVARAFLKAGCKSYIGAVDDIDQDSGPLFAITFFYHLLCSDRKPGSKCTEKEAFNRARKIDSQTQLFRYYTKGH